MRINRNGGVGACTVITVLKTLTASSNAIEGTYTYIRTYLPLAVQHLNCRECGQLLSPTLGYNHTLLRLAQ